MKKILTLDGLRGYAALFVLFAHIPKVTNTSLGEFIHKIPSTFHLAYVGVDIFFVMSGFLITRILLKEKISNNFSFIRFYTKRALRLFPIYYLLAIIIGVLYSWEGIWAVLMYVSNYYFAYNLSPNPLRHTWSLAVEEQFYLIWPVILYFFNIKKSRIIIGFLFPLIAIFAAFYAFYQLEYKLFENLLYRGTIYRVFSLSLGSFLAFNEVKNLKRSKKIISFIVLIVLLLLFLFKAGMIPMLILKMILAALLSLIILIIVLKLENKNNFINFLFSGKLIRFIGMISYGLYLYHFPVIFFIEKYDKKGYLSIMEFGLLLLICFALPVISYYSIEKPILNYKQKLNESTSNK